MNILVLRHSAKKVITEGKQDVVTASQREHAKGYALNRAQKAAINTQDAAYIIDRDNQRAFYGDIIGISERFVTRKNGSQERRQDITLANVRPLRFVDVPFIKGWETQRGVKVITKSEFDAVMGL